MNHKFITLHFKNTHFVLPWHAQTVMHAIETNEIQADKLFFSSSFEKQQLSRDLFLLSMNTIDNTLSLDDLIAKLNILTTDFIFSKQQCRHRVCSISSVLRLICEHKELVFFPEQQIVYCKMLKVWQALARLI